MGIIERCFFWLLAQAILAIGSLLRLGERRGRADWDHDDAAGLDAPYADRTVAAGAGGPPVAR